MAELAVFVGRPLPDDDTVFPRSSNSGCLRYKDRWSYSGTQVITEMLGKGAGQVRTATKRDQWLLIYPPR
jgi:hypothetical protein